MRPSRQTQPMRKGLNRQPSPVLDRMRAGRANPLMDAVRKAQGRGPGKSKRMIPRY